MIKKYELLIVLVMFYGPRSVIGEIGLIKKEIVFTGDVLNTTDRIQSLCNEFKTDLLISEHLLIKLRVESDYAVKEIGTCMLKGKDIKVKLFTLSTTI